MLLSRGLVVKCGSYCKYSLLRTSFTTVHACSQCLGQEKSDFLERYGPLKVAQDWMHFDTESKQAYILLSRCFEEIHRQQYLPEGLDRSLN